MFRAGLWIPMTRSADISCLDVALSNWQNTVWRPQVLFMFQNIWLETCVNKIPLFANAPASLPRKSNPQAEVACPAEKGPFVVATQRGYDEDDGSNFKPFQTQIELLNVVEIYIEILNDTHIFRYSFRNLELCWGWGWSNSNDTIYCMGPHGGRATGVPKT